MDNRRGISALSLLFAVSLLLSIGGAGLSSAVRGKNITGLKNDLSALIQPLLRNIPPVTAHTANDVRVQAGSEDRDQPKNNTGTPTPTVTPTTTAQETTTKSEIHTTAKVGIGDSDDDRDDDDGIGLRAHAGISAGPDE